MLLSLFLLFIGIATLLSVMDWRRGIYLIILIGIIKDPIRKMIPGAPAYLALASVPVWIGILLGAYIENPRLWADFRNAYKRLSTAIVIFLISLLPAAVKSATYGTGSWQVTLLGFFSYSSVIFGLLIGFLYLRSEKDLKRIIVFYCVATAIMLVGTPMEYLGVAKDWAALGTAAMSHEWIQTSVRGVMVQMVAGFYRSPDVMGWHAIVLSMLAMILALRTSGRQRYLWIAVAGWGFMGAILCGRRKMIFMLPVFISVFCWIYWRVSKHLKLSTLLAIALISLSSGFLIYQKMGPSTEIEKYYLQDPNKIFGRVEAHGFHSLIGTYRQSGFLGEGLGTATQGAHHLKVSKPRTWQEGGLSRVLVELGVPGFACFLFLSLTLITAMWRMATRHLDPFSPQFPLRAGLIAMFAANSASFVVSHQIFGDPFVVCFFGILIGFSLSRATLAVPVGTSVKKRVSHRTHPKLNKGRFVRTQPWRS